MSIPFSFRIPFIEQIGCTLERCDSGHAEIALQVGESHTNSFGVAHGGLLMTLLDVAMAHAARSLRLDAKGEGPGLVTIEMKTNFMRPGLGHLRAQASVMHTTASLAFVEGKVLDDKDQLCAHSTATFKFLRAVPISRRQALPLADAPLQGSGSD